MWILCDMGTFIKKERPEKTALPECYTRLDEEWKVVRCRTKGYELHVVNGETYKVRMITIVPLSLEVNVLLSSGYWEGTSHMKALWLASGEGQKVECCLLFWRAQSLNCTHLSLNCLNSSWEGRNDPQIKSSYTLLIYIYLRKHEIPILLIFKH